MTDPAKSPEPKPPLPGPPAKTKGKRRWWRWLLLFLLLIAIFHRPLFHAGLRFALIQLAAREHLTVDVHFSGNIFTHLVAEGVRVDPADQTPTPVEQIRIERLQFHYDLLTLIRRGHGEFLRSYEITNADLRFIALPSKDPGERKQKKSIAETLNNILAQPAAYSDRVRVDNLNLQFRTPEGTVAVKKFDLLLEPQQIGYLRVESLQVPRIPPMENLAAETSYTNRNFFLRELKIAPEIVIEEANFDASQRAQNKGSMRVKGRLFGGTSVVSLAGTQLKQKGENLERSYDTTLTIEASDISLEKLALYLNKPKPPVATLGKLAVHFKGEPEKPRTWDGTVEARVEAVSAGKLTIHAIEAQATFLKGRATINSVQAGIGKNLAVLTGEAELPESVNELERSRVKAVVKLDLPELAVLTGSMPKSGALMRPTGTVPGTASPALASCLSPSVRQAPARRFPKASPK
ncbi:MAG: hypothetical protein V4710_17260, partial [Verrucomicrobiota bacterium]